MGSPLMVSYNGWLYWHVALLTLVMTIASVYATSKCSGCGFEKHHNQVDQDALTRLEPICGKRYIVTDDESKEKYAYHVGICTSALPPSEPGFNASDSVVQMTGEKHLHTVGRAHKAELMAGTNWINLEYEGGDVFGTHCHNEERRAIIMIVCSPGRTADTLRWLEEDNNKTEDCHYLFELEHDAACTHVVDTSLSAGSIICIVLGTIVGVYLIVGTLYMRCVVGAKGWQQIPNYDFWRDFGNLQADGCDLVCRCGVGNGRDRGNKQYHGIGDHQIESANDDDHDEHLLPM